MARIITDNLILRGMSGRFGDFIIRQTARGPVISTAPKREYRPNKNQRCVNERFSRAAAYASAINKDPEQKKLWAARLAKGQTVYTAAIKEYMANSKNADTNL